MNPAVSEYIDKINVAWQTDIIKHLDSIIRQAIPDVVDRIQYSKPHYLKNGKYACVTGTAKGWVSLTIFNAQALETPDTMFEASENGDRKTIKIREGQAVDAALLTGLIQQAASTI